MGYHKKTRLDDFLLVEGLVKDKGEAFIIVTEGRVMVNGQKAVSPAQAVTSNDTVELLPGREYVGRGAYKLEAALAKFAIDVHDKVCVDIGSATGGFVEVLLKRGAKKVYAIDTAKGKIALKLRQDKKVVVMEGKDARGIESLPENIDFVTSDVSLVSLREILAAIRRFAPNAQVIALFKPQYETRDRSILRRGVIENGAERKKLLDDFITWAEDNKWLIVDKIESPIKGSEGNVEYLLYLNPVRDPCLLAGRADA